MRPGPRRIAGAVLAAAIVGCAAPTAVGAEAANYTAPDYPVYLYNANSSKLVTIPSMPAEDGAPVLQKAYAYGDIDTTDQHWTFVPVGDGYEIRNVNSGKCLEIADSSTDNGAPAQQWECVGIPTQHWDIQQVNDPMYPSSVYLINRNSGKCLEIADSSTDEGAPAQQWECVEVDAQKWSPAAAGMVWT